MTSNITGMEGFMEAETKVNMSSGASKIPESVWDKKDRRISRLACMNTAVEILKSNPRKNGELLTAPDIIKVARVLEQYVYEGM